jgi:hypothetical protein
VGRPGFVSTGGRRLVATCRSRRVVIIGGWFDCYGDICEYQRILVCDANGTNAGNYEIDRR